MKSNYIRPRLAYYDKTTVTNFMEEARELKVTYPRVKILISGWKGKPDLLGGLFNQ